MKAIITVMFLAVILSCKQQPKIQLQNNVKNGYSLVRDTTYNADSTEISNITRTFYINQTSKTHYLILNHNISKDFYSLMIINLDGMLKLNMEILRTDSSLLNFFSDLKTVINDPGKSKEHRFGDMQNGRIYYKNKDLISLRFSDESGEDKIHYELKRADIDTMYNCYIRYKSEK